MKRFFMVLVVATAMFATTALAQPQQGGKEQTMNSERREQVMQVRLDMLRNELQLDDATFEKFSPLYRKYRFEIQRATVRDAYVKKENLTNENALKVVAARLHNQISSASVKQRYLHLFAEVIEPLKIEQLYRVDERITREARKIMKYRDQQSAE